MKSLKRKILLSLQALKQFQTRSMVVKFSQLLTCQIDTCTKSSQKNHHFSACSIHLLVDINLKECHLAFYVQVKWPRKRVEKHFGELPTFDDIIIGGKDKQEHDLILRKALTRARGLGFQSTIPLCKCYTDMLRRVGQNTRVMYPLL